VMPDSPRCSIRPTRMHAQEPRLGTLSAAARTRAAHAPEPMTAHRGVVLRAEPRQRPPQAQYGAAGDRTRQRPWRGPPMRRRRAGREQPITLALGSTAYLGPMAKDGTNSETVSLRAEPVRLGG
jgi:hypothetical protein